ncbi:hypothetical protein K432DRAFT_383861 [Lepidopterella palustris CBS 459.81]|uniref:Uncharacterized protein n=1 Tax=Lepidopterella palustris CBS 459.81 TaxID=1314670 RepID=A0A8E2JDG2_9PEZI|nr:hypothetical protein K432DRAFT_383861 [Lepidopterella palustris CBS 459.81]
MLSATPEEARASCSNGQAGVDRATGKYRPFDRSCDSRKRREREKEERHAVRKLLVDTSPKPASPAALGRIGRRKEIRGEGKAGSATSRAAAEFEKMPHKG